MEKIVNYNGIDFKVIVNKEDLIKQAKELEEFEADTFTGFEVHWDKPKLTKEQFDKNVENFCKSIEDACTNSYIEKVVEKFVKKKNGTFKKNRKYVVDYYENTRFFQEWHNTWGTYELRFSAVEDKILVLQIVAYNHTPG